MPDNNLIETSDQLDEDTLGAIEQRFWQAETREEARRSYEFLKRRLEQAYNSAIRALSAPYPHNRTENCAPGNDEARFARMAKEEFAMTRREALKALGCGSFQEFAKQELEMRAGQDIPFNAEQLAREALGEYRASAVDYSVRYMD